MAGVAGTDLAVLNTPSERDYVTCCCRSTRCRNNPGYDCFIASSSFRVAALCHGIKGRVPRSTATSVHSRERIRHIPALARPARESLEGCS